MMKFADKKFYFRRGNWYWKRQHYYLLNKGYRNHFHRDIENGEILRES